jgi:acetyl-CoA carboxylase carboxyltransferase component
VGRAAGPAGPLDDEDMTTEPGRLVAGLFDDDSAIVFGPRSGPVNAGIAAVEGVPVIFIITGGAQPTSLTAADLIRIARATAISRRFSLPLVVVQDCAGYGPDPDAMSVQLARHVLEDLRASAAIKLSIVAGQGFVLGDFVLGGRGAGYDLIWAWPSASIPVADVRAYDAGAAAPAPDGPWAAADIRIVDDVILPSETRRWLSRALTVLAGSRAVPPTAYGRGAKLVDLA